MPCPKSTSSHCISFVPCSRRPVPLINMVSCRTGTELEWAERKMLLEGVCNMADSTTNAKLHEGGDQSASHLPDSFVGHQDWDESTKTCEGNLPETLSMNSGLSFFFLLFSCIYDFSYISRWRRGQTLQDEILVCFFFLRL